MDLQAASLNPTNFQDLPSLPLILVVEDSDEDYEALNRAFRKSSIKIKLHRCQTGKQALEYLNQCIPVKQACKNGVPALVLLDLNLPGLNGKIVLQTIKQNPLLQYLPVVVVTTSKNLKDVEECYGLGANGYLIKAIEWKRFNESIQTLVQYWFNTVILP
jgi:CheY-like chemotaxis protein